MTKLTAFKRKPGAILGYAYASANGDGEQVIIVAPTKTALKKAAQLNGLIGLDMALVQHVEIRAVAGALPEQGAAMVDDGIEVPGLRAVTHLARRPHVCAGCGRTVCTGERYVRAPMPAGGKAAKQPFHMACYRNLRVATRADEKTEDA